VHHVATQTQILIEFEGNAIDTNLPEFQTHFSDFQTFFPKKEYFYISVRIASPILFPSDSESA